MKHDIAPLRDLLRSQREHLGLSREALAERASMLCGNGFEITRQTVEALEITYQRIPPAGLLRPVSLALDLAWEDVLRAAGY